MNRELVIQDLVQCPFCNDYTLDESRPALSRFDNKTKICSQCGGTEALGVMYCGKGTPDMTDWTWDKWRMWIKNQINSWTQHYKK